MAVLLNVGVVAFYAGLNGLIALVLAFLVLRQRRRFRVGIGSGGHPALEQAMRAQANFVEYAPLILLLLLFLALTGLATAWLHALGVALTLGRALHAWGLSTKPGWSPGRFFGTALTLLTLLAVAILCLVHGAAAIAGRAG